MLLDTHFIVWHFADAARLTPTENRLIDEAIYKKNLYISAISFWEIATLVRKKRLELGAPVQDFFNSFLHLPVPFCLPLDAAIAVEGNTLPDTFHPDPADRILVATARLHNIPILTRDSQILAYGAQGHVKIAA